MNLPLISHEILNPSTRQQGIMKYLLITSYKKYSFKYNRNQVLSLHYHRWKVWQKKMRESWSRPRSKEKLSPRVIDSESVFELEIPLRLSCRATRTTQALPKPPKVPIGAHLFLQRQKTFHNSLKLFSFFLQLSLLPSLSFPFHPFFSLCIFFLYYSLIFADIKSCETESPTYSSDTSILFLPEGRILAQDLKRCPSPSWILNY